MTNAQHAPDEDVFSQQRLLEAAQQYDTAVRGFHADANMGTALACVAALAEVDRMIDFHLPDEVRYVRKHGATWQQVADALGVTKQAAQQRFGKSTD